MKKLIVLFLGLLSTQLIAQTSPKVVLKDSSNLKLKKLKVDVKIVGNFATTVYDMSFYNELNRTLEGELVFPLGQNQSVSGFAMDMNGKLRDAVVVEKELARVAFETTVRQNIDPALLEKTSGNNYKARVYPIFPKKEKRIVLTYEEPLFSSNQHLIYELPLGIKEKIDQVEITIQVLGTKGEPKLKSEESFTFSKKKIQEGISFSATEDKVTPASPITLKIPQTYKEDKLYTFRDYFYQHTFFVPTSMHKKKVKKISILWDASYSLKNRDLKKELDLLDCYLTDLKNVEVEFTVFSNTIRKQRKIKIVDGNWSELKKAIELVNYDGATNFSYLEKIVTDADEVLLFTDGMSNLGRFKRNNTVPIYTINSMVSANHEALNLLANHSSGAYINLVRLSVDQAKNQLSQQTFQFLGIKSNPDVSDYYPKNRTNILSDFIFTGRFSKDTSIELQFGYGGKVTETKVIRVETSSNNDLVRRLWAKEKLKYLNRNKENHQQEIIQLAKQYSLITDYTSLLILDRIEDYVRYEIEPPLELREQYKQLLESKKRNDITRNEELELRKKRIENSYNDLLFWYNKDFKPKRVKSKKKKAKTEVRVRRGTSRNPIDIAKRTIKGQVRDEFNEGLPGANVVVKGALRGTQTDFDGKYEIEVTANDVLSFQFLGYKTKEVRVGRRNIIDVQLEESQEVLDEVAIRGIAYGTSNRRTPVAKSLLINADEDTAEYEEEVVNTLNGFASGLSISGNNGVLNFSTNADGKLDKLGATSLSGFSNDVLLVVDGTIVTKEKFRKLKSENIKEVQVYKPKEAMKVYGEKGRFGFVLIITKKGLKTKQKEIEAFQKMIKEKIELKAWDPTTPYMDVLRKESGVTSIYGKYLEIRKHYANIPMFYVDVADFLYQKKANDLATRVLTNLIEVDIDNYELIKVLAYKLEGFKQYDLAIKAYKKVLELRPEDVQSYRDLALVYEKNKDYQKSFDLLFKIYNGDLVENDVVRRFKGVEQISYVEISRLVTKYGKKLKLSKNQKALFKKMPVDVRVVIDWNHNDTDIDLWVIDPIGEKASYQNKKTKLGGRMSDDMTSGFGPEEFMLKKAMKGKYQVLVNYYSSSAQKISGPAILKVSLFKNYGGKKEIQETYVLKLGKKSGKIEVGELLFE